MKLNVGRMVDNMIQEMCIPTDSVKSEDVCSDLVHNMGLGYMLSKIKTIMHTWLVKVIKCQVGDIRIKKRSS